MAGAGHGWLATGPPAARTRARGEMTLRQQSVREQLKAQENEKCPEGGADGCAAGGWVMEGRMQQMGGRRSGAAEYGLVTCLKKFLGEKTTKRLSCAKGPPRGPAGRECLGAFHLQARERWNAARTDAEAEMCDGNAGWWGNGRDGPRPGVARRHVSTDRALRSGVTIATHRGVAPPKGTKSIGTLGMYNDNADNFTRTGDTERDKTCTQQRMDKEGADAGGDGAPRMRAAGGWTTAADGFVGRLRKTTRERRPQVSADGCGTVCMCLPYTCGHCLGHMRLQHWTRAVATMVTCGYSLGYMRLQPWLQAVTAPVTCGYSLGYGYMRSRPRSHAFAASVTDGNDTVLPRCSTVLPKHNTVLLLGYNRLYITDYTFAGYMRLHAVTCGYIRSQPTVASQPAGGLVERLREDWRLVRLAKEARERRPQVPADGYVTVCMWLYTCGHCLTAPVICGYSLGYMQPRPWLHATAASANDGNGTVLPGYSTVLPRHNGVLLGYSRLYITDYTSAGCMRLRPWLHAVTAPVTSGYSLGYMRSRPRSHATAASGTDGNDTVLPGRSTVLPRRNTVLLRYNTVLPTQPGTPEPQQRLVLLRQGDAGAEVLDDERAVREALEAEPQRRLVLLRQGDAWVEVLDDERATREALEAVARRAETVGRRAEAVAWRVRAALREEDYDMAMVQLRARRDSPAGEPLNGYVYDKRPRERREGVMGGGSDSGGSACAEPPTARRRTYEGARGDGEAIDDGSDVPAGLVGYPDAVACGYSLGHMRLQPCSCMVAALDTCGHSLAYMRFSGGVTISANAYCTNAYDDTARYSTACYGTAYYGPAYYGTAYYGTAYYSTAYYDTDYYDNAYYDTAYYGNDYYGTAYYSTAYYDTAYYGTAYYDTACLPRHCLLRHCPAPHCLVPRWPHCLTLRCLASHCRALHYLAPHCPALHCPPPHCLAPHCLALHCLALHCLPPHHLPPYCLPPHCLPSHCRSSLPSQPRPRMVTASATYGYSLCYIWLQPRSYMVTASVTYGYSLCYIWLQPPRTPGRRAARAGGT